MRARAGAAIGLGAVRQTLPTGYVDWQGRRDSNPWAPRTQSVVCLSLKLSVKSMKAS